jgi:nucleotide-binding universal stress UspA family protein
LVLPLGVIAINTCDECGLSPMRAPAACARILIEARIEMTTDQTSSHSTVWQRVICAIDLTPASVQAARHAAQLMAGDGKLILCTVASPEAVEGGVFLDRALIGDTQAALDRVQAEIEPLHDSELHLREGPPIRRLLEELRTEHATLVAVGSHGHSRAAGIVLGSVATAMLHEAPCSVLIAHADVAADGDVVVGFDGSGSARRALAAGRELAERLGLDLRVLVATGDAHPPGPGWSHEELGPELAISEDPRPAVEALVDASRSARVLVLGSRHLRGVPALSSVSERAAHRASCPVLVIR